MTTKRFVRFVRLYSRLASDYLIRYIPIAELTASSMLAPLDLGGMLVGGRAFYLEVKKRGQNASPGQIAFIELVRECGGISGVVYSVEDALALVGKQNRSED